MACSARCLARLQDPAAAAGRGGGGAARRGAAAAPAGARGGRPQLGVAAHTRLRIVTVIAVLT
jgi:hypothetical protein